MVNGNILHLSFDQGHVMMHTKSFQGPFKPVKGLRAPQRQGEEAALEEKRGEEPG